MPFRNPSFPTPGGSHFRAEVGPNCTPISIGQGGPGLGAMWGIETASEYLEQAGFPDVAMHRLPHDPMNVYFVARR